MWLIFLQYTSQLFYYIGIVYRGLCILSNYLIALGTTWFLALKDCHHSYSIIVGCLPDWLPRIWWSGNFSFYFRDSFPAFSLSIHFVFILLSYLLSSRTCLLFSYYVQWTCVFVSHKPNFRNIRIARFLTILFYLKHKMLLRVIETTT